jgi:glycosyltransferase involved in cell wall biosynthesis
MPKRLLVPWFNFSLNGGISRFIHLARVLEEWGHTVGFASIIDQTETPWPGLKGRIMTLEKAAAREWDAVMVPGAGAPPQFLECLAYFQKPQFGIRVQHILNDPSRYDRFALVNASFMPDVVIINNSHWAPSDFRKLDADAFYILPGAVDTTVHYPLPYKTIPCEPPHWKVGGIAAKNALPLLKSMKWLTPRFRLHLYGRLPEEVLPELDALQKQDRVVYHGMLLGKDLAAFYRSLDVVVTTETQAGWCNTAAEAMANGVPAVVSRAGTVDFARHGENCLVLDGVNPEGIAKTLLKLTKHKELMEALAQNAAHSMRPLSYTTYARKLLQMIEKPPFKHYFRMPEHGLFGKWEPDLRLGDLEGVLSETRGTSVLDLGAAEGVISHAFAEKGGAKCIHGFEFEEGRVHFAERLLSRVPGTESVFRQADLSDWGGFVNTNRDLLSEAYDTVLFLGLYHHLPGVVRKDVLRQALCRSRRYFLIRTPQQLKDDEDLDAFIRDEGFEPLHQTAQRSEENLGWLGIYKRTLGA